MSRRRWFLVSLLVLLWPLGWLLTWQFYLFEALEPSSRPGFAVFAYGGRRAIELWIATGLSAGFLLLAVTLIATGNYIRNEMKKWGITFIALGAATGLAALTLPVLFPRVQSVVLDEHVGAVSVQTNWLYAEAHDRIRFADIDRIQHRRWRFWSGGACLGYVTLNVIANDKSVIHMPRGLRTEAMAAAIAEAANAQPRQIENITDYRC